MLSGVKDFHNFPPWRVTLPCLSRTELHGAANPCQWQTVLGEGEAIRIWLRLYSLGGKCYKQKTSNWVENTSHEV